METKKVHQSIAKKLFLAVTITLTVFSCSKEVRNEKAVKDYFDSLADSGFIAPTVLSYNDTTYQNDRLLRECILSLDAYANGKRHDYPAGLVDSLLDIMALSLGKHIPSLPFCRFFGVLQ